MIPFITFLRSQNYRKEEIGGCQEVKKRMRLEGKWCDSKRAA